MALRFLKSDGFSLLEFCCILCVVLPILFNLIGIIDYYRLQYLIDEMVENELGNRKNFIVKVNENLIVTDQEKNKILNIVHVKVDSLQNVLNNLDGTISPNCQYNISGALIEKKKDDALAKIFGNNYFKGELNIKDVNLENYSNLTGQRFVVGNNGAQKFLNDSLVVRLSISLDFATCSKIGSDFLNIMPNTIASFKNLIVEYEF